MDKRKVLLIVFIVLSVVGIWARYSYQQAERRRNEAMLRNLSLNNHPPSAQQPAPEPTINETRDMFGSELPKESYDLIKQAVGKEFKLMELSISDISVSAIVSTDDKAVNAYSRYRFKSAAEGPGKVNLIGEGNVEENLFTDKNIDLSIIPQMTKDALAKANLPEGKISGARYSYALFRGKNDPPEWSINIISGEGDSFQSKHILYDAKGKFKKIL